MTIFMQIFLTFLIAQSVLRKNASCYFKIEELFMFKDKCVCSYNKYCK